MVRVHLWKILAAGALCLLLALPALAQEATPEPNPLAAAVDAANLFSGSSQATAEPQAEGEAAETEGEAAETEGEAAAGVTTLALLLGIGAVFFVGLVTIARDSFNPDA